MPLAIRPAVSISTRFATGSAFAMYAPGCGREAWLLLIALATTHASAVAAVLMDELRRRRISPSVIEWVAAVLVVAERHVAVQLTSALSSAQTDALDALLQPTAHR
jgi:hypothetical protein